VAVTVAVDVGLAAKVAATLAAAIVGEEAAVSVVSSLPYAPPQPARITAIEAAVTAWRLRENFRRTSRISLT
jgi:hypothetical protein